MSKGKLIFELPEDRCEFKVASNAMSWALVTWDMAQYLRGLLKYDAGGLNIETLEAVRERLFDLLDNRGVSLDDIE